MESVISTLVEQPFFKEMDPEFIREVAEGAEVVRFGSDKYIFREGEEADYFYIITKGVVDLEIYEPERGPIRVDTLTNGHVLGWSWIVPPYVWEFDAHAIEPVHAIALDGKHLRAKCAENHELGYELMRRFARVFTNRLKSARIQLVNVHGYRL